MVVKKKIESKFFKKILIKRQIIQKGEFRHLIMEMKTSVMLDFR